MAWSFNQIGLKSVFILTQNLEYLINFYNIFNKKYGFLGQI